MKNALLALAVSLVALTAVAPLANAEPGDNINFQMVRSATATCLSADAHGRVSISDLGPVQNMHLEVFALVPHTTFTVFLVQHNARPFGLAWYQGEIQTDSHGRGIADFTGIFNEETFVLSDTAVKLDHIGIWFADPTDSANAGCSDVSTPFDGDGVGGSLVLSTSNFPDETGPLLKLK